MDWKLTILGYSSATPTLTRNAPAQVFHKNGLEPPATVGLGCSLKGISG